MNVLKLAESINLLKGALVKEVVRRETELDNTLQKGEDFLKKIDAALHRVLAAIDNYQAKRAAKAQEAVAEAKLALILVGIPEKPNGNLHEEIKEDIAAAKEEVQP